MSVGRKAKLLCDVEPRPRVRLAGSLSTKHKGLAASFHLAVSERPGGRAPAASRARRMASKDPGAASSGEAWSRDQSHCVSNSLWPSETGHDCRAPDTIMALVRASWWGGHGAGAQVSAPSCTETLATQQSQASRLRASCLMQRQSQRRLASSTRRGYAPHPGCQLPGAGAASILQDAWVNPKTPL